MEEVRELVLQERRRSNMEGLDRRIPTGGLQGFLKHAIPDYLVRGTDLFSLRLSNKRK